MQTLEMTQKPLILVDGSSYLYRAFHALPALSNSKGQPTGAMYGVLAMLRKLMLDYDPEYVAVIFDAKGKTFRDDLYEHYKAHRPPMPDELRPQLAPLKQAIQAMGIRIIEIEGIEADDVIATLAKQATEQKWDVVVSTGDKDMAQLVNEHITLVNTMSGTVLNRQGVIDKFGVPPERIIDYLTLIGDTVDNIPGVAKVGPKTAVKWLQEFHTLDNIMANADQISGKIGENLRAALNYLPLSRQLVTLQTDAKLPSQLQELKKEPANKPLLLDLYKEFEFKSWLKELLETGYSETAAAKNYQIIVEENKFKECIETIAQSDTIALHVEGDSNNSINGKIIGLSISIDAQQGYYIPLTHQYPGMVKQLDSNLVLEQLKPFIENTDKVFIIHDVKYAIGLLDNYGIKVLAKVFDPMLESYLLDSSSSRHDLETLSLKYLGQKITAREELTGKGVKQIPFSQLHIDSASCYVCEHADLSRQLHLTLWPKIVENKSLQYLLNEIEIPLAMVLSKIERHGVMVDTEMLAQQSADLTKRIAELEQKAYQIAGKVFNLASPKQLQEILYVELNLPVLERTPSGAPSTAESTLQELAFQYPLPTIILEHRGLCKLKSTYTDSLPKQIHPQTGRIHTSYHQAVTSTGRLSSTEPNLQNIPIRNEEGRRVRQAFIAPASYKIVSADYSQIELRIMAHLSKDPNLLKAFAEDLDIHTATASEIFGITTDAVTSDQRRHAKAINFGLIYGMSSFGLARQLGISRDVAQIYMDKYFEKYPGVKLYMESTRNLARKQGYVETLLGRRLYVPDINSSQMMRRRAAERAAINAPMQGTAADIIKIAMIQLPQLFAQRHLDASMIMQVHDELVFEIKESDLTPAMQIIQTTMTHALPLSVPLGVNIKMGENWDEAH
jgi:DNA polymerase-1